MEESLKQCARDPSTELVLNDLSRAVPREVEGLGMTNQVTTFEAHLMALLDTDLKNKKLIEIKDGAQIIQRVTKKYEIRDKKYKKLKKYFNIIEYNNTEPNSDLLRIQSQTGIMKKHNEFNETGKKIVDILKLKN